VRDVIVDLRRLPAVRIRIVPSTADAPAWEQAVPASVARCRFEAFVVDLTGGFDETWSQRASKKTRYKVRKAEREGVQVESDTTGRLLPVFNQLYQRSVDAWARDHFLPTPIAHPLIERRHDHAKLEMVARRLGDACRVWIAWKDGEPLSGIVVHSSGSAATYWKGATDKAKVRALGATDLLHSRAMQAACGEGRSRYDLGRSGLASLTQFKLSLGARRVEYFSYQLERLPLTATQEWVRTGLKRAFRTPPDAGTSGGDPPPG
jgi:lipid II:glycine glycyltransferase (peptidoglycan interpeptide bridge formation enzyme)